ncbi:MAG: ABC transporter permease [Acidobacteriota bacterium]|nr:ABC transporter permease [Acidobacteriota bacterium]
MLSSLLADLRYSLRSHWNNRSITILAVVCLALGVGLNATMFSVVDGVLIQSLPYRDAARLGVISSSNVKAGARRAAVSYPDYRDIRDNARSFEALGAVHGRSLTISDGAGEPERFIGAAVSAGLFDILGVHPILGRAFNATDDVPGAEPVVLLGHMIWTRRYNQNPGIINQRVLINARPHTVIGVMPEHFAFPEIHKLWVPLAPISGADPRELRGQEVYARLAPGVTFEQAQSEVAGLGSRLAAQYPASNENWDLVIRDLHSQFIPDDVRLVILLMMGGATLVLIIACTNVANLLIARATVRRREIAIRASLGAGKGRIVRQLLAESALLGVLAIPFSLGVAYIGTALLRAGIPPDNVPYYIQWRVDWRTTAFVIAIAVLTAVTFGLMPAFQAASGTLHASLKEGGRGNSGRRSWLRNALVTAEVAMALIALVGAMLFVRSFVNLNKADIGFDPKPLMTMRYYLAGDGYDTTVARPRLVRDIVERIERLPGVEAAYTSNFIPLDGGGGRGPITVDGVAVEADRRPSAAFVGVTPHFVQTIGARLVEGRLLTDTEGWERTPLALVNETMARELFPEGRALGRRFQIGRNDVDDWFTVVGIVTDIQHEDLDDEDAHQPAAYVPYRYSQTTNNGVVIRVAGDPASITPAVRAAIREADANIPVARIRTMDEVRVDTFWQYGLFGSVFSAIGILGLVLASVGVYGVLAYTVSQRRQEIGVMVALGASSGNVLRLIVGQGMKLAGIGVVIGLFGAVLAGMAAQSVLFNVSPFDPLSFVGVSLFMMGVAFVASAIPARRATKVDPIIALRAD